MNDYKSSVQESDSTSSECSNEVWLLSVVPQPGVEGTRQPSQADRSLNPVLPPTHPVASSQSLTYPLWTRLSLQSPLENTECLWM